MKCPNAPAAASSRCELVSRVDVLTRPAGALGHFMQSLQGHP
jgi:hypothetical protein